MDPDQFQDQARELAETEHTLVLDIIARVEKYVIEHADSLPEGLVLQMHPQVMHMIMRNWMPSYKDYQEGRNWLPFPVQVPVVIRPDLPTGYWRLCVDKPEIFEEGVFGQ